MASADIFPLGVAEAATVALPAASTVYSSGCKQTGAQMGAMGFLLVISGGLADASVDAILQTAADPETGEVLTDADWLDTNTRINGISAVGAFSLRVSDPVLQRYRIKFVNSGAAPNTMTALTHWMADERLELL